MVAAVMTLHGRPQMCSGMLAMEGLKGHSAIVWPVVYMDAPESNSLLCVSRT